MVDRIDRLLEAAMCDHWWVPTHTRVVCRPEIEYFHSPRNRRKFNAVVRVRPDLDDYAPLVDEVMATHRGRRSKWALGAPSVSAALEAALESAGYAFGGETDAWSIDVNAARPPMPEHIRVVRVENLTSLRDMSRVMNAAFAEARERPDAELAKDLPDCVGPGARCLRYLAYDSRTEQPVSTGAVDMYPELGFAYMWGGATIQEARGCGLYSALVTARMDGARAAGLERIGLRALRSTSGAIVEAQGFHRHGRCSYWLRDEIP